MNVSGLRFAIVCGLLLFTAPGAFAQLNRSFVSTTGNDANLCTAAAPCRSFAAALARTNSGGEVLALESGGYGPFAVSSAVTVVAAPGVHAAITVSAGDGIVVNALSGNVTLRGLALTGRGGLGSTGIVYTSASTLHIDSCVVSEFGGDGIRMTAGTELSMKGTVVRDNLGDSAYALYVNPSTSTASVVVDGCQFVNNASAVLIAAGAAVIRDSVASLNDFAGFGVAAKDTFTAELTLEHCVSSFNGLGVAVAGQPEDSAVRISNTTITNNDEGLFNFGGVIVSFGNNSVNGNGTDGAPNITIPQI